jgi:zinc and cadmium transporter
MLACDGCFSNFSLMLYGGGVPIISRIDQSVLAALLALSAGALIYVGASHLLPTAEREPRRYNLLALGAGILVALGIIATHG